MNFKKLALAIIVCSSLFASCKKCMKCSYTTPTTSRTSDEFCGSSNEREIFERQWRSEGTSFGVSTHCEEVD